MGSGMEQKEGWEKIGTYGQKDRLRVDPEAPENEREDWMARLKMSEEDITPGPSYMKRQVSKKYKLLQQFTIFFSKGELQLMLQL